MHNNQRHTDILLCCAPQNSGELAALSQGITMKRSWSLKDLRDYILLARNKEQSLLELVNVMDRGITIFRYHFFTARDSLADFFAPNEAAKNEQVKRVMGVSDDQEEFQLAKIANEANTIAAIYTLRSLYDLLAQLIRGLLLDDVLSESDCNIYRVRDLLPEGGLKRSIEDVLYSDGFKYINAFANVSKHRSLVKYGAWVDLVSDRSGVKFSAFEYREQLFPELWSDEILEKILKTKNEIITTGIALNQALLAEQA